jgi:hypothetical protein
MATAHSNRTADDDDDAEIIEAPSRVVSVALVPMETGLRAYENPGAERPHDMRMLEARVALDRHLREFPQADTDDLYIIVRTFGLECEADDCTHDHRDGGGAAEGCPEYRPAPDDDADDATWDEWQRNRPAAFVVTRAERIAEREYDRDHQGADWPEVAAAKQRKREDQAARDAATAAAWTAGAFDRAVNALQRARDDTVGAQETREPDTRPEVPETVAEPVQVDTGYSARYRSMVESTLRRVEACAELDVIAVAVVRVMLDRARADTRETWQSPATIGRRAHINEDTARDRIEALQRARIIEVAYQGGRGPGNFTRWRFL